MADLLTSNPTTRSRAMRSVSSSGRRWIAWLAVILFPILINGAELANVFKADPVLRYSFLQSGVVAGPLDIHASFDPSVGLVFEPLGRESADQLIHGKLPWWNSYQGIGAPLAGAMSPGSFYPLIFFLLLPNGQTLLDVAMQVAAGLCVLLLARRLGIGALAGAIAAILFELNGTFAWLRSGWCYPLPLLPLLVYGVELSIGRISRERIAGTCVIALAVAISISAAMLEIAYLDALLGVAWAVFRLVQVRRSGFADKAFRLAFGAAIGLLIAAPLLLAFFDFLAIAYVGKHNGQQAATETLAATPMLQIVSPYVLGPTFFHDSGYAGVMLALAAICGLFGRTQRGLRALLGGWVFVAISATIFVPFVYQIFAALPGVHYIAYNRYLDGSWEFSLALLAGFFVDDLTRNAERIWIRCAAASATVLATVAMAIAGGWPDVVGSFSQPALDGWCWTSVAWSCIAMALIWTIAIPRATALTRKAVVVIALLVEAIANYTIPTLGYPLQSNLVTGSVAFMHDHLGLQRMFTLGPISQSYGSYFHTAELDDAELPVAKNWADYMQQRLDPLSDQGILGGEHPDEIARNIDAYENAGVRYFVVSSDSVPFAQFRELIDPTVAAQPLPLLHRTAPVRIRLDGVPEGTLTAISVVESNTAAMGSLHIHACSRGRCVDGSRPFSSTPVNSPFLVELDEPLRIWDGRLDIELSQQGSATTDSLFLYTRTASSQQTLIIDGKPLKNQVASVALLYDALSSTPVTGVRLKAAGPRSLRASLPGSAENARFVNAVGVSSAAFGPATRLLGATICSLARCEFAQAALSKSGDAERWFDLRDPLRVGGSVDVVLADGAFAGRALQVRFDVSTERTKRTYHDSLVDLLELPHPAPYFSAPGCVITELDRAHLETHCQNASTLTRRELFVPGWEATVDDIAAVVTPTDGVFQSIPLPAGPSNVEFSFLPPYMQYGYLAFTIGFFALVFQSVRYTQLLWLSKNGERA